MPELIKLILCCASDLITQGLSVLIRKSAALTTILLALPSFAAASESELSVSGFGTIGYAYSSHEDMWFLRDLSQDGGKPWLTDSRLGIQLAYQLNSQIEFVGQMVFRDQLRDNLFNTVEWAFAGYYPVSSVYLRFGRLGSDIFLQTDSQNVGYAAPWVRPPVEFYGQTPFYSFDGADATYSSSVDDVRLQAKIQTGHSAPSVMIGGRPYTMKAKDYWGVSLCSESGPWRARIGYSRAKIASELPLDELRNALGVVANSAGTHFPEIAQESLALQDAITNEGLVVRRAGAGIVYDDQDWLIQAEISESWSDKKQPATNAIAGYIFAGRRFGQFLPYTILSSAHADKVESDSNWSVLGANAAQLQNLVLDSLNRGRVDQTTLSLGTRWDFSNQAAFKVQWDHTNVGKNGAVLWRNVNESDAQKVDTISVVVDFVF